MSVKYRDPEYADSRLRGCVVRYDNLPVYVKGIQACGDAYIRFLNQWEEELIIDYSELDLTPVPLGNMNIGGSVLFASRIPKRQDWRQGLREHNLSVREVAGPMKRVHLLGTPLANTILGVYPSFETSVEMMQNEEGGSGVAFSRHFALAKRRASSYWLMFRQNRVGEVVVNEGVKTTLTKRFEWLNEYLQEAKGNG